MLIICVSTANGSEVYTGDFGAIDQFVHECGEECEEECEEGYFGDYLISLFEGSEEDLLNARATHAHSSHYLAEHCDELCLGDYV